jgi:pyruvate ferredoxin oxidoreductase delta subunit
MATRDCQHETATSSPCIGEAGETGAWRSERPVLDQTKCLAVKQGRLVCMQCWLFCPEAVISRTVPAEIDLTYCKGCGICVEVCPAGAITMAPEHACPENE